MSRRSAARGIRSFVVVGVSLLLVATSSAQRGDIFNAPGSTTGLNAGYDDTRGGGTFLLLTVYAESDRKRLDRQSVIKITNQTTQSVGWQTTFALCGAS